MTFCSVANEVNYPEGGGDFEKRRTAACWTFLTLFHPLFVCYSCKNYTLILYQERGSVVDRRRDCPSTICKGTGVKGA